MKQLTYHGKRRVKERIEINERKAVFVKRVSRDGKITTYYPPRADGEYFENLFLEYGYEWL